MSHPTLGRRRRVLPFALVALATLSRRTAGCVRWTVPLLAALIGCGEGEPASGGGHLVMEVSERWTSIAMPGEDLDSPVLWRDGARGGQRSSSRRSRVIACIGFPSRPVT